MTDPKAPIKTRKEIMRERALEHVGRLISDRYRIEELIAVGGMGCVFRGSHVHMRKRVAIKLLLPDTEGLNELVSRFQREAVAGAHINHPNVASATDFGKLEDGSYFLILEYVPGVTLHEVIKQGPVPPVRAVRIARQIAAALDAAHQMGVIHRDLKPRNVMVDESDKDVTKLIDFGLAKVPVDRVATADAAASSTRKAVTTGVGVVLGTVAYMAPEAAQGMDAVDERSDLYALGVMLYEMIAGVHPFEGTDSAEIFRQHREQPPPPMRVRSPGIEVAPRLEAVVMRMLQKDPADRPENARAVIAALDAAMPSAALDLGGGMAGASAPLGRLAGSIGQPASIVTVAPVSQASGLLDASSASSLGALSAPPLGAGTPSMIDDSSRSLNNAQNSIDLWRADQGSYVPKLVGRPSRAGGPPRTLLIGAGIAAAAIAFAIALLVNRQTNKATSDSAATATLAPTVTSNATPTATAAVTAAATATAAQTTAQTAAPTATDAAAATSAAPADTAAARAPASSADSAALRATLRESAEAKAWKKASDALVALADADPAAFNDREIAAYATNIAASLELGAAEKTEDVFNALATKAGTGGPDVLYDLMSTRGRSSGAARATEMLRRKEVLEHGTPALRIAVDLRETACKDKLTLLDRAKTDGDLRAVAVLDILRSDACNPKVGQCCFRRNPDVEETVRLIRARLKTASP